MKGAREAKEVNEVNEVRDDNGGVVAFFDVDGTLVALPSLERRFFRILRYRREIPAKNLFLWLGEALRLIPRGTSAILQSNKLYLRGLQIVDECGERDEEVSSWHKDGHQAKGQASAPPRCNPRLPVPRFFAQAIERVAWHARQGHQIVLMSGTLEPLALGIARALEADLAGRGITATIRVLATRLEGRDGKWTGKISGEAMFGEAKARAAKHLAEDLQLDLERCYAYGDSLSDWWFLTIVGNPAAVNPSRELASFALSRGWPMLPWQEKEQLTQKRRGLREFARLKKSSGTFAG